LEPLDDYRLQVLGKLIVCRDAARSRDLLAEVRQALADRGVNAHSQRGFWESLNCGLEVFARESIRLADQARGAALRGVVAAAQEVITQYLSGGASPDDASCTASPDEPGA
jgi:hypothetical protein